MQVRASINAEGDGPLVRFVHRSSTWRRTRRPTPTSAQNSTIDCCPTSGAVLLLRRAGLTRTPASKASRSRTPANIDGGLKGRSSSGKLKVKPDLDYENKSTYSITFHAQEKNSGTMQYLRDFSYNVYIVLTDVNEPPGKPTVTVANNTTTPTTKLDVSWTAPTMTGKPAIERLRRPVPPDRRLSTWSGRTAFTGTGTTTTLSSLDRRQEIRRAGSRRQRRGQRRLVRHRQRHHPIRRRNPQRGRELGGQCGNVGAAVTATSNRRAATKLDAQPSAEPTPSKFEIGSTTGQITVKSGTIAGLRIKHDFIQRNRKHRRNRHGQRPERPQRHRHLRPSP